MQHVVNLVDDIDEIERGLSVDNIGKYLADLHARSTHSQLVTFELERQCVFRGAKQQSTNSLAIIERIKHISGLDF